MREIVKTFKTSAGEFLALKGISTDFYRGEFVSVVGKSGSGKSTLVNMITGIDHPTAGTVCIGETCVHTLSESKMSNWRGRNLGIVFQFFQLLPMLTLLENVVLPMDFCNMYSPAEREKRALELLALVGLSDYADKLPAAVSGGQQQSAAIARALANDPPIIIADEPTGNLDSRTADSVFEIFTNLVQQGKTILMVTHDSSLAQRSDRILLLSDGELIDPWVAQAFTDLSHRRRLWLTHRLRPLHFAPRAAIPLPEAGGQAVYLLTNGEVMLGSTLATPGTPRKLVAGQLTSLFDREGPEAASELHAGEAPVELLALAWADLQEWQSEAPEETAGLKQRLLEWRPQ